MSPFKSGLDSIFFAHVSSSATSFLSRRRSAALFSRELRFSRTAAETPPRSGVASKPSGGGDWKFTALSGLSCNALAIRRFARFSCRLLGLLLNIPLGRSGAFSRPSCVGVGGRSGFEDIFIHKTSVRTYIRICFSCGTAQFQFQLTLGGIRFGILRSRDWRPKHEIPWEDPP